MKQLFRRKPIVHSELHSSLHRCLTTMDLILLGIGAIVGAGVFVLTGVAAATSAGPGIIISYFIAGLACMFAALSYAELAASVGGCGSAYSYSYASFGELTAWLIGWNLVLEYALCVSSVSIGWSGYVNNLLQAFGIHLPTMLMNNPFEGGIVNLPAMLIIAALALLLCTGIRHSARFNAIIVYVKLITIALFILVAVKHVQFANWNNFLPFGMHGVMQGAALVFFAYIGFDAVSTAAEETINPQKSLPIGIVVSVLVCSVIYIIVAGLLTSIVPYTTLNVGSPVAQALLSLGHGVAAGIVAVGAIAGLTTVMLVMYYGLTRIFFAIARDGLLPPFFSKISRATHTPVPVIVASGIIICLISGFIPLQEIAELVNIGTLAAFTFVCAGVIVLRIAQPDLPRPFKLPFNPLIPLLGIVFCVYLMLHLPAMTWWRFLVWLAIGFAIYFGYGKKFSVLEAKAVAEKS
jgi:APA family basic amino acid/polyamine antiporter